MKSSIILILAAAALLSAGCSSRSDSQSAEVAISVAPATRHPDASPSPAALEAPTIDESNAVLATNSGSGTMSRRQSFQTHGSHMFYATCAGGSAITVVTSDGLETPIPCSGVTSRMRFVSTRPAGSESYRVHAGSRVEWAITWTDYVPEQ